MYRFAYLFYIYCIHSSPSLYSLCAYPERVYDFVCFIYILSRSYIHRYTSIFYTKYILCINTRLSRAILYVRTPEECMILFALYSLYILLLIFYILYRNISLSRAILFVRTPEECMILFVFYILRPYYLHVSTCIFHIYVHLSPYIHNMCAYLGRVYDFVCLIFTGIHGTQRVYSVF